MRRSSLISAITSTTHPSSLSFSISLGTEKPLRIVPVTNMAFWKALVVAKGGRRRRRCAKTTGHHHHPLNKPPPPSCDDTASAVSSQQSNSNSNSNNSAIVNAARRGRWDEFVRLVEASDASDWSCYDGGDTGAAAVPTEVEDGNASSSSSNATTATTIACSPLHLALRHGGVPRDVLESLVTFTGRRLGVPAPEECRDYGSTGTGETPLHAAVAAGCPVDAVERLLNGPTLVVPAVLRDVRGRTALHAACATPPSSVQKKRPFWSADGHALRVWHKRQVISTLLRECPEAVTCRDEDGMTPLEHARRVGFSQSSVMELQTAMQRQRRLQEGVLCYGEESFPHLQQAVSIGSVSSLGLDETEQDRMMDVYD